MLQAMIVNEYKSIILRRGIFLAASGSGTMMLYLCHSLYLQKLCWAMPGKAKQNCAARYIT